VVGVSLYTAQCLLKRSKITVVGVVTRYDTDLYRYERLLLEPL